MTVTLAAVALALLTAALLLEEWSWQRRVRRLAARARQQVPPMRCLVCPDGPMVDDFRTHSLLVHSPRVTAPEDRAAWGRRSA